jgi:glycosyltransferase involved in cell wall biosynthesis
MPKVSIIVPNYNHYRFLKLRLETIQSQIFQDFEIIILDDASTDNSKEILNHYRNNKKVNHILYNDVNSGSTFSQWQKGIFLSNGDYIWIAESDDYSDVTFLDNCVKILDENQELSLVFTNTIQVDSDNNILNKSQFTYESGKYDSILDNFFYNWFFKNSQFRIRNASGCVFRKSSFNQLWLEEIKNFKYSGDKLFWLYLLSKNSKFYYISKPLNFQRNHLQTTRSDKSLKAEFLRISEMCEIHNLYIYNNFRIDQFSKKVISENLVLREILSYFLFKKININVIVNNISILSFDLKFWKKTILLFLNVYHNKH